MQAILAHVTKLNSSWVTTVETFGWETSTESLKCSSNQCNSSSCLGGLNYRFLFLSLNSRAKGRNIVGQQLPTLLYITCCIRFHTLLHVVACCWELLRKVWNLSNVKRTQQVPTLSGQQCWGLLRSYWQWCANGATTLNNVGSCCVRLLVVLGFSGQNANIFSKGLLGLRP